MNRQELLRILDAFLCDLVGTAAHPDLFAPDALIVESNMVSARGEGLWRSARAIGSYQILAADEEAGTAGFMGLVWQGDKASIVGIGLGLRAGRIAAVEIIVGPARFPGASGVDARTLSHVRACFVAAVPPPERLSRAAHVRLASGYYEAVNQSDPSLAPLAPHGARIEAGTQITSNPAFRFEFYRGQQGQTLPNFGEWTAREQFERGMWNADGVTDERYPIVDRINGIVLAFTTYRPWHKGFEVDIEGAGRVGPVMGERRVALNMLEAFKIERDQITEMESVWEIVGPEFSPISPMR